MKRILSLLLVIIMLALTACGGDGDGVSSLVSDEDSKFNSSDSSKEESTEQSAEQSAEQSTEESVNEESTIPDGKIVVPDTTGMSAADAEKALKEAGFSVKVKKKPNDDVPEGNVISIDRNIGDVCDKGDMVWLYVSSGKSLAASTLDPKPSALVASRPVLEAGANSDYEPINYEFMKACWLSQYDMKEIYQSGGLQRNEEDFRAKVATIFSSLWNRGINTVIVQLRPNGDSFYPSAYYCPSDYVTGSYAIDFTYDPLAIMIEEAHKVGISFHGWINPFRCMSTSNYNIINITYGVRQFAETKMDDYIIKNTDGLLWLNPGREEVRELIINGATEIVRYYDVDGIHIDDYFYPYTMKDGFDSVSFNEQDEHLYLDDYRFDNINKLVSGLYAGVKAENPKVLFGVSPAGNPSVAANVYVDFNTWLSQPGYLDYIMPQLYWGMNSRVNFGGTFDSWTRYIKLPEIRLIPGMDVNNAADKPTSEWKNSTTVLRNCLEYATSSGECDGYSLFSLATVIAPSTGVDCAPTKAELDNLFAYSKLFPNKLIEN